MKKLLEKFLNIHMKTPVLETLFNHVAGLRSTILLKRDSNTCFSMNIAEFLKMPRLKKICERLLLNNVEPNFFSIYLKTAK